MENCQVDPNEFCKQTPFAVRVEVLGTGTDYVTGTKGTEKVEVI